KLKGGTTILIVTHDTEFVSFLTDRVLCMGGDTQGGGRGYGIVQHRIEVSRGLHGCGDSRVLHDESIPGDSCFDEAPGGAV
ncbi:MAG: ABC transporter ATP-binding protein, partial [Treponema sp.]|nr:ABC transporter ATP-binding protein [Treponema sp.]